ncbi:MAG TPA: hypothetical protein PKE41_10565, partial [Candidatus Macondimonas sp.]|nr:hypothetical protein [Candidatus Macondimonas sp.]
AGSIVQSNVAPFALMGGNPARVLGDMRRFDARLLRQHPELRPWYEEWQRGDQVGRPGVVPEPVDGPGDREKPLGRWTE